jgi:hypothetical protein
MNTRLTRRSCLAALPAAALGSVCAGAPDAPAADDPPETLDPAFPSHDRRMVAEMVGASHARVERVRELLSTAPELAKASYDWGFGDWESALGAASHVGNREIAELLIAHGARPDLFTFAMLGDVDVVRALIAARPGIERMRGPHGLTLMHHARQGGERSASVVAYLATLPGSDLAYVEAPLPDAIRDAVVGSYVCDRLGARAITIGKPERSPRLELRIGERSPLRLVHQGDATFHPVGAESVRIRFIMEDGKAATLTIGGSESIEARRADVDR